MGATWTESKQYAGASQAATFRGTPEEAKATYAKRCQCDEPQTYRDEDGERRCLCGRAV